MARRKDQIVFKEIGMVIKRHRQRLQLSVDRAVEKVGLSRSTWEKVEAGTRYPTSHNIRLFCEVLGMELSELLEQAVSFRDFIAGIVDSDLVTDVVIRDGVADPWTVWPARNVDEARAGLEERRIDLLAQGFMSVEDVLQVRLATFEEKEQWRSYIKSNVDSKSLDAHGEGLDEICNFPLQISPRFFEIMEDRFPEPS